MQYSRRHTLARIAQACGLTVAAAAGLSPSAFAQTTAANYPSQPVKLTVGFPPGGPTDLMVRELAKGLGDIWGQSVIAENKPGAASQIAAEAAVRSAPDGLNLFLGTDTPIVVLPFLGDKLPYNPLTDLKPIVLVGSIPLILVASQHAGVKTFAEFVAAAKAKPGTINYASNGAGAGLHIAMERLQRAAGISLNHVPYKGSGPALIDMLGGQINVMWDTVPSSLAHIQAGKLIPLAMGSLQRSAVLPNVPTMPELGFPGFDVGIWMGIMGPAALPQPIVQKIQDSVQTLLRTPANRDRLLARGFDLHYAGAADFAARIQADYTRNKALFATLNIKKE